MHTHTYNEGLLGFFVRGICWPTDWIEQVTESMVKADIAIMLWKPFEFWLPGLMETLSPFSLPGQDQLWSWNSQALAADWRMRATFHPSSWPPANLYWGIGEPCTLSYANLAAAFLVSFSTWPLWEVSSESRWEDRDVFIDSPLLDISYGPKRW